MGLCLYPDDGDVDSPDISWSYSGFAAFRRRLAEAEGFDLAEMQGHGGTRPWSEVTSALKPLLHHADDDGDVSAADCAAMLPRLETVIDEWLNDPDDPLLPHHITDARQLAVVLRVCAAKGVRLQFG